MRTLALAAVAIALLALGGCARDQYLTLTPEEDELVSCEPGLSIDVESLDTDPRPACNPLGSDLVFPDGSRLHMDEFAGTGSLTSSESRYGYGFVNVGIYGVVATRYTADCSELTIWGRDEAVERVVDAFGDDLGNC